MRPVDKTPRQELLARLTPVQRHSYDALLTLRQVAAWLRKDPTTVGRWCLYGLGFPKPAGMLPGAGIRGGHPKKWASRKGHRGWRPCEVLRWLERTGRVEV